MRTTTRLALATSSVAVLMGGLGAAAATAADGDVAGQLQPVPLNGVEGSGQAWISVDGTTITVTYEATGLLPDSPHAAHIHYAEEATNTCPTAEADVDGSGTITTTEGAPAYGTVKVSLTTEGDTSPASALAVERFPTAPGGNITYERGSIEVSEDLAADILSGESAVVVHGVDHNGNGKYDGETPSDLNPELPAEATDPALCGILSATPAGGTQTGGGGMATDSINDGIGTGLLAGGLGLFGMAAGAYGVRRARATA